MRPTPEQVDASLAAHQDGKILTDDGEFVDAVLSAEVVALRADLERAMTAAEKANGLLETATVGWQAEMEAREAAQGETKQLREACERAWAQGSTTLTPDGYYAIQEMIFGTEGGTTGHGTATDESVGSPVGGAPPRDEVGAEAERDRLREEMERIKANAISWHGIEPENSGHVRALKVIAQWCDDALDPRAALVRQPSTPTEERADV